MSIQFPNLVYRVIDALGKYRERSRCYSCSWTHPERNSYDLLVLSKLPACIHSSMWSVILTRHFWWYRSHTTTLHKLSTSLGDGPKDLWHSTKIVSNKSKTVIVEIILVYVPFILLSGPIYYLRFSFIDIFLLHIFGHSKICHFTRFV